MHIASGPGTPGLSGMQVKSLLPLRSVRMVPSAPIAMIVASVATRAGAARIALAISCASVGAFLSAACVEPMRTSIAATTVNRVIKPVACMTASSEFAVTVSPGSPLPVSAAAPAPAIGHKLDRTQGDLCRLAVAARAPHNPCLCLV